VELIFGYVTQQISEMCRVVWVVEMHCTIFYLHCARIVNIIFLQSLALNSIAFCMKSI
jgi:hypothetical protein